MDPALFIALGVFLTVVTGWIGLRAGARKKALAVERRLARVSGHAGRGKLARAQQATLRRDDYVTPGADNLFIRMIPRISNLRDRLARTGKRISIGGYVVACLAVGVAVGGVAYVLVGLSPVLAGLKAVSAGLFLPHLAVGWLAKRRIARFNNLFPDAIDLMVRGLRSGLPVTECVAIVASEIPDPVGAEFRRVADAVKFGSKLSDALWQAAHRLDIPEFKFFVVSLSVQQETGGNLAETLANLSDILRRRKQMRLKIKAMSSEAKASAWILGALPFLMFCIIYMMNPGYESMLFTDPRGRIILGAGVMSLLSGIFVMSRMVRFEI